MAKGIILPVDWFDYVGVNDPPAIPIGEEDLLRKLKTDLLLLGENSKRKVRDDFSSCKPSYLALGRELPDLDALSGL